MNNRGFDIIDLMIVVVIIGILAALAMPRFGNLVLVDKAQKLGYTSEDAWKCIRQNDHGFSSKEDFLQKLKKMKYGDRYSRASENNIPEERRGPVEEGVLVEVSGVKLKISVIKE